MAQQSPTLPQQPPQPPAQRYSPYPPVQSPVSATSASGIALPGPPPAKRQRLSPNPPSYTNSPYTASPTNTHLSLPGTPVSATSPTFHQPPPHPLHPQYQDAAQRTAPGSMGPPQRPADRLEKPDRATDINDLSDAVLAAGVNLREEEDYLTAAYQNQHHTTSFNSSFNSQTSSTTSPQTSFTQWSQGASQLPAFQGAGVVSQKPVTPETAEEELKRKHKFAARALAEHHQHHLNDPFLFLNLVRHKLHKRAYEQGVSLNVDGLFDKIPDAPQGVSGFTAKGPDGTKMATLSSHSILERNAPLVDVLALLSLAAQERVRGVLEDSYTLSRTRQANSDGIVPPDFADIAVGDGEVKQANAAPTALTGTSWDASNGAASLPSGNTKRSHPDSGRLPTPPTDTPPTPQPTVSFPKNPLHAHLKRLREEDLAFEKKRLAARAKRLKLTNASAGGDGSATASGVATPTAESIAIPAKLTKKERDRLSKANESAETLHKSANETAALALGFGKKKKYSWMTGGGGASGASTPRASTNAGAKATATTAGSPAASATAPANTIDPGLKARGRRTGYWRESGREGKGIQIRDVVSALDLDGKEKKTLVRILARLKSED